ncbi:MAG: succinate dehydrogenase/fumarate reductase flavoprotein subunit, partial [Chloroflexi bacterium]|nr:succinate dehydrogenase/fumarate reductase flavoprotein subunit [Chloroflexota bacterium]
MPYTEELKSLIKAVEKTRPERLARKKKGQEFPRMSLDEAEAILKKYHPDYKDEGRRELKVGPSKGYKIAHEFA